MSRIERFGRAALVIAVGWTLADCGDDTPPWVRADGVAACLERAGALVGVGVSPGVDAAAQLRFDVAGEEGDVFIDVDQGAAERRWRRYRTLFQFNPDRTAAEGLSFERTIVLDRNAVIAYFSNPSPAAVDTVTSCLSRPRSG